nr:hypothetical protein JVH1_0478 [Rhodococcus sp. JVH1]
MLCCRGLLISFGSGDGGVCRHACGPRRFAALGRVEIETTPWGGNG